MLSLTLHSLLIIIKPIVLYNSYFILCICLFLFWIIGLVFIRVCWRLNKFFLYDVLSFCIFLSFSPFVVVGFSLWIRVLNVSLGFTRFTECKRIDTERINRLSHLEQETAYILFIIDFLYGTSQAS